MNKLVLLLLVAFLSVEIGVAQGVLDEDEKEAVLDSLRYYPMGQFGYSNEPNNIYGYINGGGKVITYNINKYKNMEYNRSIYHFWGLPIDYATIYDEIDGIVYRDYSYFETYRFGVVNVTNGFTYYHPSFFYCDSEEPNRLVAHPTYFPDSLAHPIEKLYFSIPPAVGDTVLKGSARFGLRADGETVANDSIPYTIYRGYLEKTDRELEFENPQDTVIQMIQFQNDDLIYTLAKDIGLIHIDRIYKVGEKDSLVRITELGQAFIGDREMKRPKYVVVSTEEEPQAPTEFQLHANRPNPFNPSTELSFTLQQAQTVSLEVTDMLGRRMSLPLSQQRLSAGTHRVTINAQRWASGVYFYHLTTELGSATKKMLLVK